MIICLKDISEECFSFDYNANVSLKFHWALREPSGDTQALGHLKDTRALGHSKGSWALGHSKGTTSLKALRYSSTLTLEALYLADCRKDDLVYALFLKLFFSRSTISSNLAPRSAASAIQKVRQTKYRV